MLLIALAALRIVATLTVFSVTTDEPLHVTAGLQLVTQGEYAWQIENPPVPRVLFASLMRLGGTQFDPNRDWLDMMRWVFYSSGHYRTSLFLARIGNVFFFLIAALATWWLARRALGRTGGALATLLFTTQPVVLGYAGIANLDNASVAGVAVALIAFHRWLEQPAAARAAMAGLAYGISIGLKFSNLLFTAAACLALFLLYARQTWRRAFLALPIAALTAFIGVWACYGFYFRSFEAADVPTHPKLAFIEAGTPIPMPHFWRGVLGIADLDREGQLSYAFGMKTNEGWWWYFPAALMFKTTLATLVFAFAGAVFARGKPWLGGIVATMAILITAMPAKLDLGIRYVLPLYVPLTIAATVAALAMLRHARRWVRVTAIALLAWQSIASIAAHPDYFPYFNELAGREPGRYFVDSNLDWGQDMLRLRRVLRGEKVESLGILAAGLHDYDALGFPPTFQVEPWVPTQGWIVVSEHFYRMIEPDGGFWWLRGRSYRRIGKSLRLYYVP